MGSIGNYIHATKAGYFSHGITKDGDFSAYISQRENIRKKAVANAKTSLNYKERKDLGKAISKLIRPDPVKNSRVQKIQEEVARKLEERFKEALGDIDWATLDVTSDKPSGNIVGKASSSINVDDMRKKMEKLDKVLLNLAEEGAVGTSKVRETLEEIKNEYEAAIQKVLDAKREKGLDATLTTWDAAHGLAQYKERLNELIQEYAAAPPISLQKGDLFENLIAYAPMVARNLAHRELGKVVGGDKEEVGLHLEKFDKAYVTKTFTDKCFEKTKASQGKVDVELVWKGKDVKISAKNVNLGNQYVQLLSNSSLLYLLQDEDSDFVNHALNILASHSNKGSNETSGKGNITLLRGSMIDELRLIILYKALTGDVNNRTAANLFIVNDNKTGTVKVHNVLDIIDKASENLSNAISVKGLAKSSFKPLENNIAATPEERISGLLADAHSRKISVGIKTWMV